MPVRKLFGGFLLLAFVAACGGGSPTQAPGGATQKPAATQGGGATEGPAATQSGGGGGNIDTTYGKIHIELSGPMTKSADYGFIPAGSIFGGTQGSSLSFANNQAATEIVSVYVSPDGKVVMSWVGSDFSAPGTECTTSNWNIGGSSGSGSFDCTGAVITSSGAVLQDARIKGNFEAHT